MTHPVFDVIAKDPEKEHVAGNVRDAAVHEHRYEQSEVDRKRGRLQTGNQELLTGGRNYHDAIRSSDVAAGNDLSGHGRVCQSKSLVSAELLQEDKDEDIGCDQKVVNNRRCGAITIIVVKRKDHLAPLSGMR